LEFFQDLESRPLKPASRRQIKYGVSSFFNWAEDNDLIDESPVPTLKLKHAMAPTTRAPPLALHATGDFTWPRVRFSH
jgi:hypothetical protein